MELYPFSFILCFLFADYAVYHSLYDDFIWMEKFGDPLFQRHVAGIPIPRQPQYHQGSCHAIPCTCFLICWKDGKLDTYLTIFFYFVGTQSLLLLHAIFSSLHFLKKQTNLRKYISLYYGTCQVSCTNQMNPKA